MSLKIKTLVVFFQALSYLLLYRNYGIHDILAYVFIYIKEKIKGTIKTKEQLFFLENKADLFYLCFKMFGLYIITEPRITFLVFFCSISYEQILPDVSEILI